MSRYEYPNNPYYAYNETFVDDEEQQYPERCDDNQRYYQSTDRYDDRLDYLNLSMRESPIGEGPTYRHIESTAPNNLSRDRYHQQQQQQQQQQPSKRYEVIRARQRSSSVPSRRRNAHAANVLAPMMAQVDRQQTLRRSYSTILPPNRHRQADNVRDFRRTAQLCSTPRIQRQNTAPIRLKSYSHFMSPAETSLTENESLANQRNTAIISPNYRQDNQSAIPLLANSPVKLQFMSNSPNKSNSWMNISSQRLPSEPLWFAGLILLFSGGGTCLLCLYILSKNGRQYYLDFGAISGFVCLILGMIGCRTSRWLPHRHYVTGYILLSTFSLLQCGVLAVLASDMKQIDKDVVDVAGGAVCGLAALSIVLATLGFLTSACCHLTPPDSRVSHSVQGFTV
ncbi:sanpodo [Lycorma delicatula]|uniref:sanpodo n=1 Tax=Lycorma delicatula TaxID=130591 RepID=UPI003F50F690